MNSSVHNQIIRFIERKISIFLSLVVLLSSVPSIAKFPEELLPPEERPRFQTEGIQTETPLTREVDKYREEQRERLATIVSQLLTRNTPSEQKGKTSLMEIFLFMHQNALQEYDLMDVKVKKIFQEIGYIDTTNLNQYLGQTRNEPLESELAEAQRQLSHIRENLYEFGTVGFLSSERRFKEVILNHISWGQWREYINQEITESFQITDTGAMEWTALKKEKVFSCSGSERTYQISDTNIFSIDVLPDQTGRLPDELTRYEFKLCKKLIEPNRNLNQQLCSTIVLFRAEFSAFTESLAKRIYGSNADSLKQDIQQESKDLK